MSAWLFRSSGHLSLFPSHLHAILLSFRGTNSSDTRDWRKASRRLRNSRQCESLDRSMNAVRDARPSALSSRFLPEQPTEQRFTCACRSLDRSSIQWSIIKSKMQGQINEIYLPSFFFNMSFGIALVYLYNDYRNYLYIPLFSNEECFIAFHVSFS